MNKKICQMIRSVTGRMFFIFLPVLFFSTASADIIEDSFDFVIEIEEAGTVFSFRVYQANDMQIDWGNGFLIVDNGDQILSNEFSSPGEYTLRLKGEATRISFFDNGTPHLLRDITSPVSPGVTGLTSASNMFRDAVGISSFTAANFFDAASANIESFHRMFAGASNFNQDLNGWDTSEALDFTYMFLNATSFNGDIGSWDISSATNMTGFFQNAKSFNQDLNTLVTGNVTRMNAVFQGASNFNGDISDWDTSNVTTMSTMFNGATSFNRDISGWVTTNLNSMHRMFYGASSFNSDIGGWDTSNVTNMADLFYNATDFNQDISGWDTSNVTNMTQMFRGTGFNHPIGGWDTSNVTRMSSMFTANSSFDQDISGWNTSNVTNMFQMFSNASSFNQNIGGWNVAGVENFGSMFASASNFNQDLSGWNTSSATNMNRMFSRASSFNSDIGTWDVSRVTDMGSMFFAISTSEFDQDLSDWDISNVTNMENFLYNVTLSTEYYDNMLVKWSTLDLKPGLSFSGGSSEYSKGTPALRRNFIIDNFGWSITDGGEAEGEVLDPLIELSENSIDFYSEDWVPLSLSKELHIYNSVPGEDNLNWSVSGYADWISFSDTSGSVVSGSTQTLIISADISGLEPGIYNTSFTIEAPGAINSPRIVNVSLTSSFIFLIEITEANQSFSFRVYDPHNAEVDWGEGYESIASGSSPGVEHTFTSPGEYRVKLRGEMSGIRFGELWSIGTPELLRDILTPVSYGISGITQANNMFAGATGITTFTAEDFFDEVSSNVTHFSYMFSGASSFNSDISNWDTSNATTMFAMFRNCTSFRADISGWDVSGVTNFTDFFRNMSYVTPYYDNLLINWSYQELQGGVSFNGGNSKYSEGEAADRRAYIISEFGWTINDGGIAPPANPVLTVSEENMSFAASPDSDNPPSQVFLISNTGDYLTSMDWEASWGDVGWLSVYPATGSVMEGDSAEVSLLVDTDGLSLGVYNGTVTITAPGAAGSPQELYVELTIGNPVLEISTNEMDFGDVAPRRSKTLNLTVSNTGTGVLEGSLSPVENWIIVNPSSFAISSGEDKVIRVTVDNSILNKSGYAQFRGRINVTSNGGDEEIEVSLIATCVLTKPNPFSLSKNSEVRFFGSGVVPNDTLIRIYTLSGDKVITIRETEGNNEVGWDGRTPSGRPVVPGIYIYTTDSPTEKNTGRMIIIP